MLGPRARRKRLQRARERRRPVWLSGLERGAELFSPEQDRTTPLEAPASFVSKRTIDFRLSEGAISFSRPGVEVRSPLFEARGVGNAGWVAEGRAAQDLRGPWGAAVGRLGPAALDVVGGGRRGGRDRGRSRPARPRLARSLVAWNRRRSPPDRSRGTERCVRYSSRSVSVGARPRGGLLPRRRAARGVGRPSVRENHGDGRTQARARRSRPCRAGRLPVEGRRQGPKRAGRGARGRGVPLARIPLGKGGRFTEPRRRAGAAPDTCGRADRGGFPRGRPVGRRSRLRGPGFGFRGDRRP